MKSTSDTHMDSDESLEHLQAEAKDGDSGAALALADHYFDQGAWAEAEEQYRRTIEFGNPRVRYLLGRTLHEQQRLKEAEPVSRQTIAEGDMRAAIALGNLFSERRDPEYFETAEALYRQALDAEEEDVLLNYAALLAKWPGREDQAERMYRRCIGAGDTDAHNNLGMMLREIGRLQEAETEFRKGIEAGDLWAWYGLGMLLLDQDRLEQAEEAFKAAIAGGRTVARENLIDLYLESARVEDAEREYLAAIAAGDADSHIDLGILYQNFGRFDEAELQYQAAIRAGIAQAHISLGNLFDEDLDRPVDAENQYRLAIAAGNSAGADTALATYNLAVCLGRQGRDQEALGSYRAARDLGLKSARWVLADLARAKNAENADTEVWIGVATVRPLPGNDVFEGAAGAVTNVCALARDEDEYRGVVGEVFGAMGFNVYEIEDVEPFQQRAQNLDPGADIFEMAADVSESSSVIYDEFYVFESPDE